MEDLEREKDLEEDEYKTNAKPSTTRTMTTRTCNNIITYQYESDTEDFDDNQDDTENEEPENPSEQI